MEKTTPESSSLGSLSDTKEKATEGAISFWTREQCVDWLRSVGVPGSVSGTKNDLIKKIKQFKKYPHLLQSLKPELKDNIAFQLHCHQIKYHQIPLYGNKKISQK